jgi:hypothetical protein
MPISKDRASNFVRLSALALGVSLTSSVDLLVDFQSS